MNTVKHETEQSESFPQRIHTQDTPESRQATSRRRLSFVTNDKTEGEGGEGGGGGGTRRRRAGGPHKAFKAVCWRGLRGSAIEEKAWNRKAAVLTPKEGTTRGRADVAAGVERMSHPDREGVFSRAVNTDWTW